MTTRTILLSLLLTLTSLLKAQNEIPAVPAEAPSATDDPKTLILREGDQLEATFYDQADLNRTVTLAADGTAVFQFIDSIKLGGLTKDEATEALKKAYKKYLVNPQVILTLKGEIEQTASITGAVTMPKKIVIPRDGVRPTVLSAINQAQGLLRTADSDNIILRRLNEKPRRFSHKALTAPGAKQFPLNGKDVIEVGFNQNANKFVTVIGKVAAPGNVAFPLNGKLTIETAVGQRGGVSAQGSLTGVIITRNGKKFRASNGINTFLRPNDVVTVPIHPMVGKFVTMANFIAKPGPLPMPFQGRLTVSNAIAQAGGIARRGDLRKVSVLRKIKGGGAKKFNIDVKKVRNGQAKDMFLQHGDTVSVGARTF